MEVSNLCFESENGESLLKNISFRLNRTDKVAFISRNPLAVTALFKVITGELEPKSGFYKWGGTITRSYFPKDNGEFFDGCQMNLIEWMRQYTTSDEDRDISQRLSGKNALFG